MLAARRERSRTELFPRTSSADQHQTKTGTLELPTELPLIVIDLVVQELHLLLLYRLQAIVQQPPILRSGRRLRADGLSVFSGANQWNFDVRSIDDSVRCGKWPEAIGK